MNTIALDVRPSVFLATHYPSPMRLDPPNPGGSGRDDEDDYLDGFLGPHPHVFDVAVGDSGTGKSHFIRWAADAIRRRDPDETRYRLILVPRSSANLADVLRRILKDSDGAVATTLRKELEGAQALDLASAKTRVLDEFAFVLKHGQADIVADRRLDDVQQEILTDLFRLLYSPTLRLDLESRPSGIVERIAKHVLGTRVHVEEQAPDLHWRSDDLMFPAAARRSAGAEGDLAEQLKQDDALASFAAECLNLARPIALRRLLRFRSGDLKRALAEVRREIGPSRDLILLMEDLSVTEGLDAELVEALVTRPSEEEGSLCRLRSIVGVTHDDFARMRDNVREGRTRQIIYFDLPVGDDAAAKRGFSSTEMARFSAGYLNASRYPVRDLDSWAESTDGTLPSACRGCPNQADCFATFGEVDGRGLYPFSVDSLARMYRHSVSSHHQAFNARRLVGRVLNTVLADAEHSIPNQSHPSEQLRATFKLAQMSDTTYNHLRRTARPDVDLERIVRAVEMYSPDPGTPEPYVPPGVERAFAVKGLDAFGADRRAPVEDDTRADPAEPHGPHPTPAAPREVDPFVAWWHGGPVSDKQLNEWRGAVLNAVTSWIDWDSEGLGGLTRDVGARDFGATTIQVEGQLPRMRVERLLLIERSSEAASALRLITGRLRSAPAEEFDAALLALRRVLPKWAHGVRASLTATRQAYEQHDVLPAAASLLAIGAVIRKSVDADASTADLWAASLDRWPDDPPRGRSPEWMALCRAYVGADKAAAKTLDLLVSLLACTKGAQVGSVIDPSPVLDSVEHVRRNAAPLPLVDGIRADLGFLYKLSDDVNVTLARAIEVELEAASGWLAVVRPAMGSTAPKKLFKSVRDALQDAFNQAVYAGPADVRSRLESAEAGALYAARGATERAIESGDPFTRLQAVARFDREAMALNERLLIDVASALDVSLEKTNVQLDALLEGGDLRSLEADVMSLVNRLADTVRVLEGTEP